MPAKALNQPTAPADFMGLNGPDYEPAIAWLGRVRKEDLPQVGGKCANLGELLSFGVEVPPGFAVTAPAYQRFLAEAGLDAPIAQVLLGLRGVTDPARFQAASKEIQALIVNARMPSGMADDIRDAYEELSRSAEDGEAPVAVRSSATSEDLPDASFAGQQDTYLNVRGIDDVLKHVQRCWASLFTPRALFYRQEKGYAHDKVLIAVAVQRMVASRTAGVLFTINPVSGDPSKMTIESTWGLGEALVSGRVRPDRFVVEKATLEIVEREMATKEIELRPGTNGTLTVERGVPADRQTTPSLSDDEVRRLVKLARRVEEHYGSPQDIEFAIEPDANGVQRIYLLQARPETIHSKAAPTSDEPSAKTTPAAVANLGPVGAPVLKGLSASPGSFAGVARIVRTTEEASRELREGDILVTKMTNPDWVPYMKIAGAIVTDDGGVTCHAAIVSREMGVPCIVGARTATKTLQTGKEYTVDAKAGVVYGGRVEAVVRKAAVETLLAPTVAPVTSTKVYVNLSIPDLAEKVARDTHADGVGLLRAEHLMLTVGKHPRLLIEEGGAEKMVAAFADGVRRVAAPFSPRPIVYRFLDFKPDEFVNLPGGKKYEEEAGHIGVNPLLGYRGCFRYVKEPDIFRLECQAIRRVREQHKLRNVHVMLPFVRTVEEFRHAKKIMEEEGLRRGPDFKLWLMVEVPSTVLLIDQFLEEGLDGVSFGTNDLTMLILGIDRDDASVQEIYDERNLAVLRAMSHVVRACRAKGVTTSICGQAPSNYPEVVEFLVRDGATSLSVNADKVIETKMLVATIERKLILEATRSLNTAPPGPANLQPQWAR